MNFDLWACPEAHTEELRVFVDETFGKLIYHTGFRRFRIIFEKSPLRDEVDSLFLLLHGYAGHEIYRITPVDDTLYLLVSDDVVQEG